MFEHDCCVTVPFLLALVERRALVRSEHAPLSSVQEATVYRETLTLPVLKIQEVAQRFLRRAMPFRVCKRKEKSTFSYLEE